MAQQPADAALANVCPNCHAPLVVVEKRPFISISGCFGAILAVAGIVSAIFTGGLGLILTLVGVVIGSVGTAKKPTLCCTACSYSRQLTSA